MTLRTGQIAIFTGYMDRQHAVGPVFQRGDIVVIGEVHSAGDLRCFAATLDGKVLSGRSDLLWPEEIIVVNNAPLVISDAVKYVDA